MADGGVDLTKGGLLPRRLYVPKMVHEDFFTMSRSPFNATSMSSFLRKCPLSALEQICAVELGMSALGHKRTFQSSN
jgi:hypothetical protein